MPRKFGTFGDAAGLAAKISRHLCRDIFEASKVRTVSNSGVETAISDASARWSAPWLGAERVKVKLCGCDFCSEWESIPAPAPLGMENAACAGDWSEAAKPAIASTELSIRSCIKSSNGSTPGCGKDIRINTVLVLWSATISSIRREEMFELGFGEDGDAEGFGFVEF